MGYIRHHAILVTSWDFDRLRQAHRKARELFTEGVSPIVGSYVNGYTSFFVGPDGSKEGWRHSDDGDDRREAFVRWLGEQRYEDGSTWLAWAEVQYGDDEGAAAVLRYDRPPALAAVSAQEP